jgi:predicted neuraminidase
LLATAPLLQAEPLLTSEFIFEQNPVPSCHATTLVETKTGALVAAWFAGTAEGKEDVGIWASRKTGEGWTPPEEIADGVQADGSRVPCWNPVLFQPAAGPLLLFYKAGPSPSKWWGMMRSSDNDGRNWSAPKRLPEGIFGPIKNKPVQLPDGSILSGSSEEGLSPGPSWQIHFERSRDNARTWERISVPQPPDSAPAIQPSILFLGASKLMALGRTRAGKLFSTASEDNGASWSRPTLLPLPNPNSGTDALTLKDGRHVLIYNHTAKGRSPLNVAVSKDGLSWDAALVLEDTPGEFSYPAVIQTADGRLHFTYTWKRKLAKHVAVDPAALVPRPMLNGEWPR